MDLSGKTFGQYNIIRQLGRGGMGEVYEVEHRVLRKRYALKLLRQDFSNRSESVRRFELEAEVMAKLEHLHIVRVDGFGETEGRLWLQMELVNGVEPNTITLADYAERRGGKIPADEFKVILRQILEGLAFAHSKGVVHRDLKPGNILLERGANGALKVKVSDFGLARVIGEDFVRNQAQISFSSSHTLSDEKTISDSPTMPPGKEGTSTRALLGTWVYMSPEQRRGDPADMRSDVYAIGVVCYRLLTGQELGRRAISEFGVNKAWDAFVDKALEQDASLRYADGRELLDAFLKLDRKSRAPVWLAAGAVVVAVAAGLLGLKFYGPGLTKLPAGAGNRVSITNQPARVSAALNSSASFSVGVAGDPPLTYQWRLDGINILGASNDVYSVASVNAGVAGDYSVVVANPINSVTSAPATLTVVTPQVESPFPVAGQRWTNSLGMVFIPLTNAKLSLSCFETRVQDFDEFRKVKNMRVDHPSFRQDKNHPVINVSWTEAQSFCAWLTGKERDAGQLAKNQVYRLPLRSEWCQAIPAYQPANRYVWGDGFEQLTNGMGNVLKFNKEGSHTLPVGSFMVNRLGFADLVGNAAEWLGDSEKMGDIRYIIGGAWDSEDDADFRVTAPPQIPKYISREDVGFRCLLDLDPQKPVN